MSMRFTWVLMAGLLVAGSATSHAGQAAEHQHPAAPAEQTPVAQTPAPVSPATPPALPPFIAAITDADRAAAFPDVSGHAAHDDATHYFVLIDQLEWQSGGAGVSWENRGWIGRDRDRLWFRSEGDLAGSGFEGASAHLLYGRQFSPWWDVVTGVRHDAGPGPDRAWAAIGLQGLAPYWFEVELTGYVGAGGQTQVRFETEYELLITNRLILQPRFEVDVYGKAEPDRGIGPGLSSADLGLRLRYEFRREFAPYVGVVWNRPFFGTGELTAPRNQPRGTRVVVGGRFWF